MEMQCIAHIYNDFTSKFGIPRQSSLVSCMESVIVLEPDFQAEDSVRGLEAFSHLWLIWHFSEVKGGVWHPTVRPPRLGGNKRVGVFATRSPFRPNPIGLSSVRLERIERTNDHGNVLVVSGADLMNGTPIFDIKPYLPYADCHADAQGGFTDGLEHSALEVVCEEQVLSVFPKEKQEALFQVLALDPRPQYHSDPNRVYQFEYSDFTIGFTVDQKKVIIRSIREIKGDNE